MGFVFELVLADSLYGESKQNFVNVLDELNLPYILAIRSNHGLWLPQDPDVYSGWKNLLNNLRLIIQPLICFNGLKRWLEVFPIASLHLGFAQLTHRTNSFICLLVHQLHRQHLFSSA